MKAASYKETLPPEEECSFGLRPGLLYRTRFEEEEKRRVGLATRFLFTVHGADGRSQSLPIGGNPGFVQTIAENALIFAMRGNAMAAGDLAQSLKDAHVVLTFDAEDQCGIHVKGIASVTDTPPLLVAMPGARFAVRVTAMEIHSGWPDACVAVFAARELALHKNETDRRTGRMPRRASSANVASSG